MYAARLLVVWAGVCLLELVTVCDAAADPLRYRAGLRNVPNKYALKPKQLESLLHSLRAKTGWPQLTINDDGFFQCDDREQFNGGSASARTLLAAALNSPLAFDLENRSNELNVTFARLEAGVIFKSMKSGNQIEAHPLQIDFADFRWLRGSDETLAAFDVGMVVLHEIAHGVWGLRDAVTHADEPGECESYINRIRRELQLPERLSYFARVTPYGPDVASRDRAGAELIFSRLKTTASNQLKKETLYLRWDAAYVGMFRPDYSSPRKEAPMLTDLPTTH